MVRTVKTTFERYVKLNRAVPPEMLLAANLIGTEAMVRARLRAHRDAGIDVLRLSTLGRTPAERIAHRIGGAQALQARACGVEPTVDMNPCSAETRDR